MTPKYTCVSVGKSSGSMRVWTIVVVALQVKLDEREEEDDDNGSWSDGKEKEQGVEGGVRVTERHKTCMEFI